MGFSGRKVELEDMERLVTRGEVNEVLGLKQHNLKFIQTSKGMSIDVSPKNLQGSSRANALDLEGDHFYANKFTKEDGEEIVFVMGVKISEKNDYRVIYHHAKYQYMIISDQGAQKIIDGKTYSDEFAKLAGVKNRNHDYYFGSETFRPHIYHGGDDILFQVREEQVEVAAGTTKLVKEGEYLVFEK